MSEPAYEVTIAKFGTRIGRREEIYLNHHLYGEPDAPLGMDYFVWVVRDAAHTILVDTGYSRHGGEVRGRTLLRDPVELLGSLGVDPAAAPIVAITHGHYDHVGNVVSFPDSEIVIAEDEIAFWGGPHAHRRQFHHSVEDDETEVLLEAARSGRARLFRGTTELAPGVEMIQLGGHTPGQSVVKVPTSAGTVLLASDAVHYYEEYERDMPFSSVADLVSMYEGFDRIRAMETSGEIDHIVAGHDPGTLDRFRPLGREVGELAVVIGERNEGTAS
jgi:glyoxylase-like metal-dependent hydrolase (beta-lactamase superfamily II)